MHKNLWGDPSLVHSFIAHFYVFNVEFTVPQWHCVKWAACTMGRRGAVEATLGEFLFYIVASFCVLPYVSQTPLAVIFVGLSELRSLVTDVAVTGQTNRRISSLMAVYAPTCWAR